MTNLRKLWIALLVLVVLSPLGLILPARFGAGSAWGEWSAQEVQRMVGYVPSGMSKLGRLWNAPMPDYAFKGHKRARPSVSYIFSGLLGAAVVVGVTVLIGKALGRRDDTEDS